MGIPRFFKLQKNKQFDYKPIYYDPVKEEREARKKEIERELGITSGGQYSGRLRKGAMREYFNRTKKVRRQSNYRLIFLIIILLFVAYLILYR